MIFDRFDICGAYWAFWSRHHTGQWSHGYKKLSQLVRMRYSPSSRLQGGSFDSENQREIYKQLLRVNRRVEKSPDERRYEKQKYRDDIKEPK